MTGFEKTLELSLLFRIYKNLLTPKQNEYFVLYFEEDLSLQEIANELEVSRAAVHDSINKTTKLLYSFEEKLGLKKQLEQLEKIIDNNKNSNNIEVKSIIEKLEEIL